MQERMARINNELANGAGDKVYFYTPTATTAVQLTALQQVVRITNNFAFTLSLPPVSKCKGLIFTISTVNATAAVKLTDFGGDSYSDSIDFNGGGTGYYQLDAAEDRIALFSDGQTWHEVQNLIS